MISLTRHRVAFPVRFISLFLVLSAAISLPGAGIPPVHACDELAANPKDPHKTSFGVEKMNIYPGRASEACEQALKMFPHTPRFHYQLGRAFAAAEKHSQAFAQYSLAADRGYAAAHYNLAFCHGDGKGTPANPEKAERSMRKAVDLGFPGERFLNSFMFSSKGFSKPAFFDAVYSGDLDQYNVNPDDMIVYLLLFIEPIYNTKGCEAVISDARADRLLETAQTRFNLDAVKALTRGAGRYQGTGNPIREGLRFGGDQMAGLAAVGTDGKRDAELFYGRYGCVSPIAEGFFSNLNDMLEGRRILGVRKAIPRSESDSTGTVEEKPQIAARSRANAAPDGEKPASGRAAKTDDLLGGLWGGDAGPIVSSRNNRTRKTPFISGIKSVESSGSRSIESIARVIRMRALDLRAIYNGRLKRGEGFEGRLELKLTIAPSGSVVGAEIVSSNTGVPAFDAQAAARTQAWRFEPVKSKRNEVVIVPFTFEK